MTEQTAALPRHVAIIMDGNGRWANERGRPRTYGHQQGVERVREIVRAAGEMGVEVMTLFAFSTENWRRPDYEIKVLMNLFRRYIVREVDELDRAGIRVRFLGQHDRIPADLRRLMAQTEDRTRDNSALTVQVALSYGGRDEITRATRHLATEVAAGRLDPAEIDEQAINGALDTEGEIDPDLVIRTSGETRVSNFLLWQAAYAEFAFVEECWPAFTRAHFEAVLAEYANRERRFGKIAAR
jgi:undecaprenyl diphosphate synthase